MHLFIHACIHTFIHSFPRDCLIWHLFFTAEVWEIIKVLEQRFSCIQIYYFYRLTSISPDFTLYEAGTSLDWDGDRRVCSFKFDNKDIILCW